MLERISNPGTAAQGYYKASALPANPEFPEGTGFVEVGPDATVASRYRGFVAHPEHPNERENVQGDTAIGPVIDQVCRALLKQHAGQQNLQK